MGRDREPLVHVIRASLCEIISVHDLDIHYLVNLYMEHVKTAGDINIVKRREIVMALYILSGTYPVLVRMVVNASVTTNVPAKLSAYIIGTVSWSVRRVPPWTIHWVSGDSS